MSGHPDNEPSARVLLVLLAGFAIVLAIGVITVAVPEVANEPEGGDAGVRAPGDAG